MTGAKLFPDAPDAFDKAAQRVLTAGGPASSGTVCVTLGMPLVVIGTTC